MALATTADPRLRQRLTELLDDWDENGRPGRDGYREQARDLLTWRDRHDVGTLWDDPPSMLTATVDDGFGFGLDVIELYAQAAGLDVRPLGLLQTPERIIEACRANEPDILGMTVLQLDTEEALTKIAHGLPAHTKLIAGGPLFGADPDLATRSGVDTVAHSAAGFIKFLLDY